MKQQLMITATALVVSLAGCATSQVAPSKPFQPVQLNTSGLSKKADNFFVLMDNSSSMNDDYNDRPKIDLQRDTVSHLNQTVPPLDYRSGLGAFGSGPCLDEKTAKVLFGVASHNGKAFDAGLNSVTCASGVTPMGAGLSEARASLAGSTGKTALIVISDAKEVYRFHDTPRAIESASKLKAEFGDRLCIYPIQVGRDPEGKVLMDEIARIGGCGFAANADDLATPGAMGDYVNKVLLQQAAGAPLVKKLAPEKLSLAADALFDFDKAILKPEGKQALDDFVGKLSKIKYDSLIAVGYTDRLGSESYNKDLSVRRAEAVKAYLTGKGIGASQVFTDGKGKANPVTGDSCKGAKKNKALIECLQPDRRVEVEVAGTRE